MTKKFTAKVLPMREELIDKDGAPSMVQYRPILIEDSAGKTLRDDLRAADNREDMEAKISGAGFIVERWDGDGALLVHKPMTGGQKTLVGCFGTFMVGLLLLLGGCMVAMNTSGDDEPDEALAIVACENIVRDQQKAPSTAEFSSQSASGAGSSWTSTGTVRSENSFGGTVANDYTCSVTFSADETYTGSATFTER